MELICGIHNLQQRHKGCVLSIGNFDGVHLGHQALLNKLQAEGQRLHAPVMVMIFEPQPMEFFSPETAPPRLTRLRDKYKHLASLGIDYLLCVNFNKHFAAMSAETFVTDLLVDKLATRFVVVGDDFRFGAERLGNIDLLIAQGHKYGFTAIKTESFLGQQGQRISSTVIRQALSQNDFVTCEAMLGRPYSISGRVVHGNALGRTIGFPTANIALNNVKLAVKGVYAVEVKGLGPHVLLGVANIGTRPTISGEKQQLEVHLLDFNQNLYGKHIEVVIRKKIRNEQRFGSLDELKQQIAKDEATARAFFATSNEFEKILKF